MTYAIISLGGKQYRVQEGEKLLVDRVATEAGKTFQPSILLVGGDGEPNLGGDGVTVTARVVDHVQGEKIRIGKYRPKSGYRKHTGFRAQLSRIEIESIGAAKRSAAAQKRAADETPPAAEAPVEEAAPAAEATPAGLPDGYAGLTVAQVSEGAKGWSAAELEAALAYEREHANRKGALAALESAKDKEDVS